VAETYFVPWVEEVMPLKGRTVLEYGCGNGSVTAAFEPRSARYIGLTSIRIRLALRGACWPIGEWVQPCLRHRPSGSWRKRPRFEARWTSSSVMPCSST
jgi:hypothetical protein